MTATIADNANRRRSRVLGLIVLGAALIAPLAANADDHHPPHHRHQVCKNVRVSDHHGHWHNSKQCHWVNR
ncbi:hypothetical protein KPL74_04980 [Bacillus sp. NP157]|nr:hypothetical protein KPL74_04980 [Bacillus sp. NP157]